MEVLIPSLCVDEYTTEIYKEKLNKRPFLPVHISGKQFRALIDTGAAISGIDYEVFEKLNGPTIFKNEKIKTHLIIKAANGSSMKVMSQYNIPIEVNKRAVNIELYVIKNMSTKLILGMDFYQKAGIIVNGMNTTVSANGKVLVEGFYGDKELPCAE